MKKRWLCLALCLALMMGLLGGCDWSVGGQVKNPFVNQEQYMELIKSRTPQKLEEPPALCINGVRAVYETKKQCFFFSVTEGDEWETLTPSVEGYETVYVTAFENEPKLAFLGANRSVKVLMYNEASYASTSVIFTSLPVLSLTTKTLPPAYHYQDEGEEQKTYYDDDGEPIPCDFYAPPSEDEDKPIGEYDTFMEIVLLDPLAESHGYENGFTSLARAHIRGRSSREYPKNSFKLELLQEVGGILSERDVTMLGMRSDGDWNLNGMYAEPSKVRDKVAMDLWLNITADRETAGIRNGYRGEYVEMIINGKYFGLYLMTERIDRKQLDLADEDRMFFAEGDIGKTFMDFRDCEDDDLTVAGYSLDWPKERAEPYDEWFAMEELTRATTWNIERFREWASTWINAESLADYEVFVQAAAGVDNVIQNTFLVAHTNGDGTFTFSFVPWDMDQTFGNRWHGDPPLYTGEDYRGMTEWNGNYFWVAAKMRQTNANGYRDTVNARYNELRKTVISDKTMIGMIEDEYALLTSSGAFVRNKTRWPDGGYINDVTAMTAFVADRMSYIDRQYQ